MITTLLIGIAFVLCWTPSKVHFIIKFVVKNNWGDSLYKGFNGLVACNLFINPIIYCFKYDHFRSQLKDTILKMCRNNQVRNEQPIPMNPQVLAGENE